MGVEARGRTYQLQKSYRTTQEIMQFSTAFYRQRLPDEKDEDILVPNLLDMPTGSIPQIINLSSAQDEITRVANEVADFLHHGFPRNDIYVLHANFTGVEALIKAINRRVGHNAAMEPKDTYPGNYVRVTTINAGPGLESPIVFLVGLRTLFEEEQSLRLSDDERAALIEENTRKIFSAATRAGQRLVFTYVGELPKELIGVLMMVKNP
jgi:superfamily I DNA/RNA helicase